MVKIKILSIMIATLFICLAVVSIVGATSEGPFKNKELNKVYLEGEFNVKVSKSLGLVLPAININNQSVIFKVNSTSNSLFNKKYRVENELVIKLNISDESERDDYIIPRSMFYGVLGIRGIGLAFKPIKLGLFNRVFPIRGFGSVKVVKSKYNKNLSEEIRIRIKYYEITKELLGRGENIILNIYVMGFLPDDVNGVLEGTKVVAHKVINLEVTYEEIV